MDPNATLELILQTARQIGHDDEATPREIELADAIEALHTWIANGGFLPAKWSARKEHHETHTGCNHW